MSAAGEKAKRTIKKSGGTVMKKKLWTIFICLVMTVGLLPTVAFAAENYNLYVNGEQFKRKALYRLWKRNRKL